MLPNLAVYSHFLAVYFRLKRILRLGTKLTPYDILSIYILIHEPDLETYIESLPDSIDCPLTWMFKDIQVRSI